MSKSEELAKLLGIEGKLLTCQETDCKKSMSKKVFCNEGKHFTCPKIKYVYPDFELPSNFVELLELAYKISGIIDINFNEKKTTFINDFLDDAIITIKKYPDNYKVIEFKQQAQQIKWDY